MAAQEATVRGIALLLFHNRGLALLLLLLLVSFWAHVAGAGVLRLLHIQSNNLDNEPAAADHVVSFSDKHNVEFENYGKQNLMGDQREGKRMMLLLSTRNYERKAMAQPGSKPPQCHSECNHCQGGACVATPFFSRSSSSSSQHAFWSCTCLH